MERPCTVQVCQHTNCLNNGSAETLAAFTAQAPAGVTVCGTKCLGLCNMGPSVYIESDQTWYCRVQSKEVLTIVEQHLQHNKPVTRLLHPRYHMQY
jgi:(2Fe-2S) ferredoxin